MHNDPPFDLTDKDKIITFSERDPYNPQNIAEGYVNRDQGQLYGSLWITKVNGKDCKQLIYSAPKQHYPFDRNDVWSFPDCDYLDIFEKLDGTCIIAYTYKDTEGNVFLTYKTRLKPFLSKGKYGNFFELWNEMLKKYPQIEDYCFDEYHNCVFELYGKRNRILVEYDIPLDTQLIFTINASNGQIYPPNESVIDAKVPMVECKGTFIDWKQYNTEGMKQNYLRIQQDLEYALIVDKENEIIKGEEGQVWYFMKDGSAVQIKCLAGLSRVYLPYGTKKTIREIVNKNYKGYILSYDRCNKKIVKKKIIGWYRFINNERIVKLSYENAPKDHHVFVTETHKILTNEGYKNILEFNEDTKINTGMKEPNDEQKEVLLGILLGDGCIPYNHNTINIIHSSKQSKYVKYIRDILWSICNRKISNYALMLKNKSYHACKLQIENIPYTRFLKKEFYGMSYSEDKKVVPSWFKLTPISLAFWYMDDGNKDKRKDLFSISVQGFNENSVDKLLNELLTLGIVGDKRNYKIKGKYRGFTIHFNVENSRKISKMISKYVPNIMEYKICRQDRGLKKHNFNKEAFILYANPVVSNSNLSKKEKKFVYCIDVEDTHNFLTNGGIVHNCKPPTILKYHWSNCAISFESLYTTIVNAFENFDNPTYDDVVGLLSEEFTIENIEKSRTRITKILHDVLIEKKLQYEILPIYNKLGVDINMDKKTVMRHFATLYPKEMSSQIFCLLNRYVNKKGDSMETKKKCKSTMEFGDDHGDNTTTFHCQLEKGHKGKHKEEGDMDGKPYTLEWDTNQVNKKEIGKQV